MTPLNYDEKSWKLPGRSDHRVLRTLKVFVTINESGAFYSSCSRPMRSRECSSEYVLWAWGCILGAVIVGCIVLYCNTPLIPWKYSVVVWILPPEGVLFFCLKIDFLGEFVS